MAGSVVQLDAGAESERFLEPQAQACSSLHAADISRQGLPIDRREIHRRATEPDHATDSHVASEEVADVGSGIESDCGFGWRARIGSRERGRVIRILLRVLKLLDQPLFDV